MNIHNALTSIAIIALSFSLLVLTNRINKLEQEPSVKDLVHYLCFNGTILRTDSICITKGE